MLFINRDHTEAGYLCVMDGDDVIACAQRINDTHEFWEVTAFIGKYEPMKFLPNSALLDETLMRFAYVAYGVRKYSADADQAALGLIRNDTQES